MGKIKKILNNKNALNTNEKVSTKIFYYKISNQKLKFKKYVMPTKFSIKKPLDCYVISKEEENADRVDDILETSSKEIEKQKKQRRFSFWFLIINLLIIAGLFTYNAATGGVSDVRDLFTGETYWRYLFLAVAMLLIVILVDTLGIMQLIFKSVGRIRFFTAFKTYMLGRYYDSLTPMSTGGQPFQIFYLKSRGIRADVATAIPLSKYFVWQFVNCIISVTILIVERDYYLNKSWFIVSLAWISLIGMVLIMLGVLLLSLSKKVMPRMLYGILKFAQKIKLCKNYKNTFRKVLKFVRDYQQTMKTYMKHIPTMIIQCLTTTISILFTAAIPFCIYKAFNPFGEVAMMNILVNVLICTLASSLFPLPGGSGASEISFATLFVSYFPKNFLVWALVLWRLVTYYSFIVFGALLLGYDTIWGNKKNKALLDAGFFKEKYYKKEAFRVDNGKKVKK